MKRLALADDDDDEVEEVVAPSQRSYVVPADSSDFGEAPRDLDRFAVVMRSKKRPDMSRVSPFVMSALRGCVTTLRVLDLSGFFVDEDFARGFADALPGLRELETLTVGTARHHPSVPHMHRVIAAHEPLREITIGGIADYADHDALVRRVAGESALTSLVLRGWACHDRREDALTPGQADEWFRAYVDAAKSSTSRLEMLTIFSGLMVTPPVQLMGMARRITEANSHLRQVTLDGCVSRSGARATPPVPSKIGFTVRRRVVPLERDEVGQIRARRTGRDAHRDAYLGVSVDDELSILKEETAYINDVIVDWWTEHAARASTKDVEWCSAGDFHRDLDGAGLDSRHGWRARAGKRWLVAPVCLEKHWALMIVDLLYREMVGVDSLGTGVPERATRALEKELGGKWAPLTMALCPSQRDSVSCGLFVMEFVRVIARVGVQEAMLRFERLFVDPRDVRDLAVDQFHADHAGLGGFAATRVGEAERPSPETLERLRISW